MFLENIFDFLASTFRFYIYTLEMLQKRLFTSFFEIIFAKFPYGRLDCTISDEKNKMINTNDKNNKISTLCD